MHDDELRIDADTAAALIADRFPQWRGRAVAAVPGSGTVHAIFRIGEDLSARFPLRPAEESVADAEVRRQFERAAEFARSSPVPAPVPVAIGAPGHGYPLPWLVQTWLPGRTATPGSVAASDGFADDLAALIGALRLAPTLGRTFDGSGRGGDLHDADAWMAVCFERSRDVLDVPRSEALWARLRDLPPNGPDVMSHGDLIPQNLLVVSGRLTGVLDTGAFAPADRSLDLVAAWHLLDARRRARLREALGCTDLEWQRGAAWAFEQAMGLPWYYARSNPAMAALGRSTLDRLLRDAPV